jgi:hypothetical protein
MHSLAWFVYKPAEGSVSAAQMVTFEFKCSAPRPIADTECHATSASLGRDHLDMLAAALSALLAGCRGNA